MLSLAPTPVNWVLASRASIRNDSNPFRALVAMLWPTRNDGHLTMVDQQNSRGRCESRVSNNRLAANNNNGSTLCARVTDTVSMHFAGCLGASRNNTGDSMIFQVSISGGFRIDSGRSASMYPSPAIGKPD